MANRLCVTAAFALVILGPGSAYAAADEGADSPALARYTRTGEFELCIKSSRIKSSRILNRHQILFQMSVGNDYLAEPDCPSLRPDLALSYDATNDKLCNTSVIRLIEPGTGYRGSCGIEHFEKLDKK